MEEFYYEQKKETHTEFKPDFDFETFKVLDRSFDFENGNDNDASGLLECKVKNNVSGLNNGQEEEILPDAEKTAAETTASAEIILICTSLGSIRRQFFSSRRAKNFLDCKGAPYFLIDANRDVSEGNNLKDQYLLNQWVEMKLLKFNPNASTEGNSSSIAIPQILIDGIPIGNETSLQDLEEDTYLDLMIVQSICPACLTTRHPQDSQCSSCFATFLRLIPPDFVAEQTIQQICCGQLYYDSEEPFDPSF